ncbi:tyrosine-type recombinase/integrase [Methylobacillus sp. Pita2]|uniref:tyrosine-type recombinase/integrase n=1 Tax=Methylobacillus sp. Pita2 TaxID=3383245 RepID=UPI0038B60B89
MQTFHQRFLAALNPSNDGSSGLYRGDTALLAAEYHTDQDAIAGFLAEYTSSPATHRTYARETERLHMWAVLWKSKALSDLSTEDFQDYLSFLDAPDTSWVSKQKFRKENPNWRPFVLILDKPDGSDTTGLQTEPKLEDNRGLANSAIVVALASIGSLLNWLVQIGYLRMNTLAPLRKEKRLRKASSRFNAQKVSRFLDDDMWNAAIQAIEDQPRVTPLDIIHYERNRFILAMFTLLGSRVSEASSSSMADFVKRNTGWFWEVTGKGDKDAEVACPNDFIESLMRWRNALGLPGLPSRQDKRPLLPPINKFGEPLFRVIDKRAKVEEKSHRREGITDRRINQILKTIFSLAANNPALSEDKKATLRNASAHWLRHTSITQKIHSGMSPFMVQEDARHSDIRTTNRYSHDKEKMRSDEAQKHKLNWGNKA